MLAYVHGRAGVIVIVFGLVLRGGLFVYGRTRAGGDQHHDEQDGP